MSVEIGKGVIVELVIFTIIKTTTTTIIIIIIIIIIGFSNDKVTNLVTGGFIEILYKALKLVQGCTMSLNHHNLIKRLLSCLIQSQEQKL